MGLRSSYVSCLCYVSWRITSPAVHGGLGYRCVFAVKAHWWKEGELSHLMQEHFSSQWACFDLKESALLATKGTDSLRQLSFWKYCMLGKYLYVKRNKWQEFSKAKKSLSNKISHVVSQLIQHKSKLFSNEVELFRLYPQSADVSLHFILCIDLSFKNWRLQQYPTGLS